MGVGCAYDWDRYDPRRGDGALADGAAVDAPSCGNVGQPCCAGNSCVSAALCTAGACQPCPTGQIACAGQCVDPQTNSDHCGACGTICRGMNTCTAGSCR